MDNVVLQDGTGGEVVPHVDEGGQGARGEALDPLHGGGGGVRAEGVQPAVGGPQRGRLLQHRQLVLVGPWRLVGGVVAGEVDLQGVDDEQQGPLEARLGPAEVPLLPAGLEHVVAGAGPVHLQSHQEEAAHKQVDAHVEQGAQPQEQAENGEPLHPEPRGTDTRLRLMSKRLSYGIKTRSHTTYQSCPVKMTERDNSTS